MAYADLRERYSGALADPDAVEDLLTAKLAITAVAVTARLFLHAQRATGLQIPPWRETDEPLGGVSITR
jgi:hypothetical protein